MQKTILITGASSGFGRETTKLFQAKGWNVIASMRSPEKENELNQLENVLVSYLDVTDSQSIEETLLSGISRFGKIDVLLNNAGYGAIGSLEAAPEELIRKQFDVNLFGLINVTKAVLPYMRKNREGIIINISSMGGKITFPFGSLYHATKFAVEGLTVNEGIDFSSIKGLIYIPNFITRLEEKNLIESVNSESWLNDLKRRVQHYGYKYDYRSRTINYSMYLGCYQNGRRPLLKKILHKKLIAENPDQLIVNEYLAGQGIASHVLMKQYFR